MKILMAAKWKDASRKFRKDLVADPVAREDPVAAKADFPVPAVVNLLMSALRIAKQTRKNASSLLLPAAERREDFPAAEQPVVVSPAAERLAVNFPAVRADVSPKKNA